MKSFSELGLIPPILKALEEMGFSEPTPVQEKAIPQILSNKDLIVMSKTGSGKTAVFGVSMLQMINPADPGPQGLILTPTRELAVQIDNDLKKISAYLPHQTTVVYGQHSMNIEIKELRKGASIITGTPGRVFDHIRHGNLNTRNIRFLVLDEADRMLDMGFIGQVVKIVHTLPKNRSTLLFSATIPSEVKRICSDYMKDPVTVEIESRTLTVDTVQQIYYRVNHNEKRTQLERLLLFEQPESCIIFCNTRKAVDQVQHFLTKRGYASHGLHGDIAQGTRMKTMEKFKQGDFHILVATDVAARGIHVDDLSLVINYDVPIEKDSYVHRIGRTGRAGNGGRAVSLVTGDDLMTLYEIEEHIGVLIEEMPLPTDSEFNAKSDTAQRWIQENSLKEKPSQANAPKKGTYGGSKSKKSTGQRRNPEHHPVRSDDQQTQKRIAPDQVKQSARRESRTGDGYASRSATKATRPSSSPRKENLVPGTRPGSSQQTKYRNVETGAGSLNEKSIKSGLNNTNEHGNEKRCPEPVKKESLIKRFLGRLFGKQHP